MNAFIDLRKSFFKNTAPVSFAEYYLENPGVSHAYVDSVDDSFLNKIARLRTLYTNKSVSEAQIINLLSQLGENDYIDRYSVDLVIRHPAILSENQLKHQLKTMLTDIKTPSATFCHLLDICIECKLPLLKENEQLDALNRYKENPDALSMILDYMSHFQNDATSGYLNNLLNQDYPPNINMQILEGLVSSSTSKESNRHSIKQIIRNGKHPQLYMEYLNLHHTRPPSHPKGFTVVQTMFYGDPECGGKGQSGGLGTFLKTLGNHLAEQTDLSRIVTLTINNDWSNGQTLVTHYSDKHWLIRLPAYMDMENKHAFLIRQLFIKRFAARFMAMQKVTPDIVHIRYLDNASRAMGMLSQEAGAKLVLTLTPDPHRTMVDEQGHLKSFPPEETLERLNKISIGDELLSIAHGVLGIGGMAVKKDLRQYFPQLKHDTGKFLFKMIGEGINTETNQLDFDVWHVLTDEALPYHIHREFRAKPIILNVGRLTGQKGQDQLIKAWGESRLWKDFNLVIIGGNVDNPNQEETRMLQSFAGYMEARPDLDGRFAHVEALPNDMIRNIERKIMAQPPENFSHIYLCSSQKEEFGISILEALEEKFLIFGPVQGGVKTYIKHGENGFLIDTTSWETISQEVETILYHSHRSRNDFEKIQHQGQQIVLKDFSMDEITKHFRSFYLELKQEE